MRLKPGVFLLLLFALLFVAGCSAKEVFGGADKAADLVDSPIGRGLLTALTAFLPGAGVVGSVLLNGVQLYRGLRKTKQITGLMVSINQMLELGQETIAKIRADGKVDTKDIEHLMVLLEPENQKRIIQNVQGGYGILLDMKKEVSRLRNMGALPKVA